MSIWEYANPKKYIETTTPLVPWALWGAVLLLVAGLVWGFFFTPDDFRQGATVKIFYLHVPSAMMAISAWFMMLVASLIWLIRRHHVSALAAKAAAPVGIVMTLMALFTGAIWGQPMWGTWWAWDPRLTSFLILFLFYLGYVALWEAIEDPISGTKACISPRPCRWTRKRMLQTSFGIRRWFVLLVLSCCSSRLCSCGPPQKFACAGSRRLKQGCSDDP